MSKNPITPPEHVVCLLEIGEPLYVPRRSDTVPAEAWVPYPKPIPLQWHVIAEKKGFSIHSRIRDRFHLCLRCNSCGALTAQKIFTLRTAQPACVACQCKSRQDLAQAAGLEFMYRDSKDRHYGMFRAPCGHKISRQFAFLERIAAGEVEHRCEHCLQDRERTEAERIGWSFLSRDMDNADYRIYRHSCGHVQRVARVNMRWGQVDCAGCGQSWCSRPSYIYLLQITWPDTNQQMIKVGFSAHPDKRFRHQLGLPDSATVDLLRTLPFETGHEACRVEKGMHSHLCKTHPDAVVPCTELEGHINVVSEVYRPSLLPEIHALFDRVVSEQVR
jgi:hypothetical protein